MNQWLLVYLVGIPVSFCVMTSIELAMAKKVQAKNIVSYALGSVAWPLFVFVWLST
jgi:hypothetical protein